MVLTGEAVLSSDSEELAESDGFLHRMICLFAPNELKVAEWVAEVKKSNPDKSVDEIAEYLAKSIVRTYTAQGAALALPGAIPGLGTIAQIGTELGAVSADLALLVRNQTYLAFALGHCYGITGRETLVQDTLIIMGLWSSALVLSRTGAIHLGKKVVEANFKKHFPAKILQSINRRVGTTILTKYGTKRGAVALGRLIPLGVGVLIGGGFNYFTMRRFKNSAVSMFRLKISSSPE